MPLGAAEQARSTRRKGHRGRLLASSRRYRRRVRTSTAKLALSLVAVASLMGCGAAAHVSHRTRSATLAAGNPASTRPAAASPHGCLASLRAALTTPAARRAGAAGMAPQAFALFRRAAGTADRLPTTRGIGELVGPQLDSYDPSLTRRIFDPPVPTGRPALSAYVVVGEGFGSELTDGHFPCFRHLPARRRRETGRALAQGRVTIPVGPTFCFEAFSRVRGKTSAAQPAFATRSPTPPTGTARTRSRFTQTSSRSAHRSFPTVSRASCCTTGADPRSQHPSTTMSTGCRYPTTCHTHKGPRSANLPQFVARFFTACRQPSNGSRQTGTHSGPSRPPALM
jgi:hypothetical protein